MDSPPRSPSSDHPPRPPIHASTAEPDDVLRSLLHHDRTADRPRTYERLHASGPIVRLAEPSCVVVTGYELCREALRRPELSKLTTTRAGALLDTSPSDDAAEWVDEVFMQDESHRRLRSVFADVFAPRRVGTYNDALTELCDDELEVIAPGRTVDVVPVAARIPGRLVSRLIGFDDADFAELQPHVDQVALALEPWADPEQQARGVAAGRALTVALNPIVRARRRQRRPDLVSALVHDERDEALPKSAVTSLCVMAFSAGYQTTMCLISNAVLLLAAHPELPARLRADRLLVGPFLEEVLRLETPAHFVPRTAIAPFDLGGLEISEGEVVVVVLGAAHRDPTVFAHPDRLDLERPQGRVLSFAPGPTHCCGEQLGRVEAAMVIDRMLDRFAGLELTTQPIEWREGAMLHGPARLLVRFS